MMFSAFWAFQIFVSKLGFIAGASVLPFQIVSLSGRRPSSKQNPVLRSANLKNLTFTYMVPPQMSIFTNFYMKNRPSFYL